VKIVLCALKCDLREEQEKDDDEEEAQAPPQQPAGGAKVMIQYNEGLEVARQIGALRYLGEFAGFS
jgi:Rho family, other